MKIRLVLISLLFLAATAYSQMTLDDLLNLYNTRSVPYISVEALKMKLTSEEVVLLDARERKEFDVSHIPSATFVGYNTFSSEVVADQFSNKDAPIVVYCSLGVRSEVIGEKLKKAGFTNVYNLYGGIFEWKNKDYVVMDISGEKTENVHIYSKTWGKWLNKGVKVNN